MSELKAYIGPHPTDHTLTEYYLKSKVNKLISELEERIADGDKDFEMANNQNERLLKIVRHHKYKRCLAMAGRCRLRGRLFGACGLYEKELWALKWHNRWLELAERLKEAK